MTGVIKKLVSDKMYGFIKTDRADYFFHKEDFDGHWLDLIEDYNNDRVIEVEFEPSRTSKGLRAVEVHRTDRGV